MKRWYYVGLFLLSLVILSSLVYLQPVAGYMDAEYYFSGAIRLYEGKGFTEEILWNYLDDPAGLPHPSHVYWMPLVSILGAAGMWLAGSDSYLAGRLLVICLALCLPVAVAAWSYRLHQNPQLAMLSGLLAVFSAFYLPYITHTDSFSLVMLIGLGFFVCLDLLDKQPNSFRTAALAGVLGVLSGLMHLARADGFLWLVIAIIFFIWQGFESRHTQPAIATVVSIAALITGYLLIMGPWFWRNYQLFGEPLAPGNFQALWLNNYDELFSYPASLLTPQSWLASGWEKILKDRIWALGLNFQTMVAVQGEVFLFPLILLGLWSLRHKKVAQVGISLWFLILFIMTIIFPYAGSRGGFFHSGAALQPLFWMAAPVGLDKLLEWASRLRRWDFAQARKVFQPALVGLAILLSIMVILGNPAQQRESLAKWGGKSRAYQQVEQSLQALGIAKEEIVMVNNPPGYYIAARRPAIVIPYGDIQVLLDVAQRYQARFLLLEFNQLQGDADIYKNPTLVPQLIHLGKFGDIQVFEISLEENLP